MRSRVRHAFDPRTRPSSLSSPQRASRCQYRRHVIDLTERARARSTTFAFENVERRLRSRRRRALSAPRRRPVVVEGVGAGV